MKIIINAPTTHYIKVNFFCKTLVLIILYNLQCGVFNVPIIRVHLPLTFYSLVYIYLITLKSENRVRMHSLKYITNFNKLIIFTLAREYNHVLTGLTHRWSDH